MLVDGHWLSIRDCDERARGLFARHYSMGKHGRMPRGHFCGPGERMMLLTADCDAFWLWRLERYRRDGQDGVNCAVFRNEGAVLSSDLVREASELAWRRWPGRRLFTYVDGTKIRSANPGYCFLMAGWRRCGRNADGRLTILERLPA